MPFGDSPPSLFRDGNCPGDQRKDQSVNEYISPHDSGGHLRVALGEAEPGHGDQDEHPGQQEADLLQAKLLLEQGGKRSAEPRRDLCQWRHKNGLQASRQAQFPRGHIHGLQPFELGIPQPVNDSAVDEEEGDDGCDQGGWAGSLPTNCSITSAYTASIPHGTAHRGHHSGDALPQHQRPERVLRKRRTAGSRPAPANPDRRSRDGRPPGNPATRPGSSPCLLPGRASSRARCTDRGIGCESSREIVRCWNSVPKELPAITTQATPRAK